MESLIQDVRFALRSFGRRRLLTGLAVGITALAIGAATSIFSIVDGVLFRSLPYRQTGQLVAVWQTMESWRKDPVLSARWNHLALSYPAFKRWRAGQTSFAAVGAWASGGSPYLQSDTGVERVPVTRATSSLFETLGVSATIGRTFAPGEDDLGGPHVALLSYENWKTRFGGRPDVIGRTVRLDTTSYQIVGVLPEYFTLARGVKPAAFFVPAGQERTDTPGIHNYTAIARLAPGVTLERASLESNRLLDGPAENRGINLTRLELDQTRTVRAPLLLLLGAVGLLVLIACVNVATLLLGEATSRERELGARIALGATRGRVVRQLLTESIVLAIAGGAIGTLLAVWMTKGLIAIAPSSIPGIQTARIDTRILLAALAGTSFTGILFGLAPAVMLSGVGPSTLLRGGGQSARGRGRLQSVLVSGELVLSVVLLVGAGLLSRSLNKLTAVDPGFRADHLLLVNVGAPRGVVPFGEPMRAVYGGLLERFAGMPGVIAATGASLIPFDGGEATNSVRPADAPSTVEAYNARQSAVVPNYFSAMGIPLRAGRAFTTDDREGTERVVIITEALARLYWPNESPLGRRVQYQNEAWTVVGIVGDTKSAALSDADLPTIYTPFAQSSTSVGFALRTTGDPTAIIPAVRAAVRSVNPLITVTNATPMDERIRRSFSEERFRTLLIDLFGVLASVLATAGMYGVTARAVSQRTREVGIRVALGATASGIVRLIIAGTLRGVIVGLALGSLAAIIVARLLTPYLFGVTVADPVTYAGILAPLVAASLAASWIPARRAGAIAPATVLRSE